MKLTLISYVHFKNIFVDAGTLIDISIFIIYFLFSNIILKNILNNQIIYKRTINKKLKLNISFLLLFLNLTLKYVKIFIKAYF